MNTRNILATPVRIRVLAVIGALIATALFYVAVTWVTSITVGHIAWLDRLSPRERSVLRTLFLFLPVLIVVLGVALRRRPGEQDGRPVAVRRAPD